MKYLIKYASRSRPENFERGLISIIENATAPENIVVLVSLDVDDTRLSDYMTVIEKYWSKVHIKVKAGESHSKIHAINREVNEYKAHWDILINFSDDMIFTMKGWDSIIADLFARHFPNGDGFLHLPDGNQNENISTMSIMDRRYYDRDDYIYHPSYISLWCDVEATDVAKIRQRHIYVNKQLFKHIHPAWGLAPFDKQYLKTESYHHVDKLTYDERKQNNFGNQTIYSDSHIA